MAEPIITGWAIQWNQPAVIAGAFEERFAKGAFDKSLSEYPDVAALWSHDSSRPLARVSNGSLRLRADDVGLWFSIMPNTESPLGQECIAMVGSDTVNQMSVSFAPEIEEWDDDGDLPKRLITQARLFEVSVVMYGAYGASTSAGLRSDNNSAARRRIQAKMRARGLAA